MCPSNLLLTVRFRAGSPYETSTNRRIRGLGSRRAPWRTFGLRPPRPAAIGAGFVRLVAGRGRLRPAGASRLRAGADAGARFRRAPADPQKKIAVFDLPETRRTDLWSEIPLWRNRLVRNSTLAQRSEVVEGPAAPFFTWKRLAEICKIPDGGYPCIAIFVGGRAPAFAKVEFLTTALRQSGISDQNEGLSVLVVLDRSNLSSARGGRPDAVQSDACVIAWDPRAGADRERRRVRPQPASACRRRTPAGCWWCVGGASAESDFVHVFFGLLRDCRSIRPLSESFGALPTSSYL